MNDRQSVRISGLRVESGSKQNRLSAEVDGEEIFIAVPSRYTLYPRVEPFLAVAMLEAMISGLPIVIDDDIPVSAAVAGRFAEVQSIFANWNRDLTRVPLIAQTTVIEPTSSHVACFFSGGIDSSHALLHKLDTVTHLVVSWGFDSGHTEKSWAEMVERYCKFANSISKQLIPIRTNIREWTDKRRLTWRFGHGLYLSTVGGALGMARVYVPSSHNYDELFPWGTHPLLDPMWSTEASEVIHYGAGCSRSEKVRDVIEHDWLSNNLQVCWRGIGSNCGACPKCVRTMVAIELLGGSCAALPRLDDLRLLKYLKPKDEGVAASLEELIFLAKTKGNEAFYRKMRKYYYGFQRKQLIGQIDRYFFGGIMRRLYRRSVKPDWLDWRVTRRGKGRWDI
ncbi:hypothetical protein H2508_06180 [Parahaliea sp. F7430]|uniref:Uncharacterized protein n=1 Tax=Sediminihaliea albiluteola TaxID=2758564 RepID=A0A7W2YJV9_9GAMM|nr:hypothetical protein [Sediminihaliea albiluteola]MBA6412698.1 hypothetical protein [Sediminihaliea albiluteola]